jgi:hypothetical protein
MGVKYRANDAITPSIARYSKAIVTTAPHANRDGRPSVHNHMAHPNHSAAGVSTKTPIAETNPIGSSRAEMMASGSFQRFQATRQMARPVASQMAATTREVIQSQVTTGDSLVAEQPHGLDAMTKTESRTANTAAAAKAKAVMLVVRTADRVAARRIAAW